MQMSVCISYARLLIEVDITQPLLYKVQIEGDEGKMIKQQVLYEWVPMYCQQCHKVRHVCKERKPEPKMKVQKQQWQKKDKGKEVVKERDKEGWNVPQKVAIATISG